MPDLNSYLVIIRSEVNFRKYHSTQKSIDQVVNAGECASFLGDHLLKLSIIDVYMGSLVLPFYKIRLGHPMERR